MKVRLLMIGVFGLVFPFVVSGACDDERVKNIRFEAVIPGEDLTKLQLLLKKRCLKNISLEFRDQAVKLLEMHWALYLQWIKKDSPVDFKIIKIFDKELFIGFFSFSVFKGFSRRIIFYESDPEKHKAFFDTEEVYIALHASPLQEGYAFVDQLILPYLKAQYPACKKVYGSASAYFPDSVKRFEMLGLKEDADYTELALALSEGIEGIVGYSSAL